MVAAKEENFSVDCCDLKAFSPRLYTSLCNYPREVVPIMDEIVVHLARELMDEEVRGSPVKGWR